MSRNLRMAFFAICLAALSAGFAFHAVPAMAGPFERLHIFLFNLVAGGSCLILFARGIKSPDIFTAAYFCVALLFTAFAFYGWPAPSAAACLALFCIVEAVRIMRFSFFPFDFFRTDSDTADKFLQAALLCLSIGLLLCALAIADHAFFHWFDSPKFGMETFFLGFSFPVSLITFYCIFSIVPKAGTRAETIAHNAAFWLLNLGVIIFFLFILAGSVWGEAAAGMTLYYAVLLVMKIMWEKGEAGQPKIILLSGLGFLLGAALTGIAYILIEIAIGGQISGKFLMRIHAFYALYGWNLSGLLALSRRREFPLTLSMPRFTALHWAVVAVLAPAGLKYPAAAAAAVIFYALLLSSILFAGSLGGERSAS